MVEEIDKKGECKMDRIQIYPNRFILRKKKQPFTEKDIIPKHELIYRMDKLSKSKRDNSYLIPISLRNKAFLSLLYLSGLRISEFLTLKIKQIRLTKDFLFIYSAPTYKRFRKSKKHPERKPKKYFNTVLIFKNTRIRRIIFKIFF
jgi:site-specific recombinase XerD